MKEEYALVVFEGKMVNCTKIENFSVFREFSYMEWEYLGLDVEKVVDSKVLEFKYCCTVQPCLLIFRKHQGFQNAPFAAGFCAMMLSF